MDAKQPLFMEQQSFPRIWLILSGVVSFLILWISHAEFGIMHWQFPLTVSVLAAMNLFIWLSRLTTIIQTDFITYRFFPLQFKTCKIGKEEIKEVFVRKYNPLMEYGGWGFRWSFNGRAVNMKGNKGIQVVLKNGSRILIGTSQPEEASKALELFFTDSVA